MDELVRVGDAGRKVFGRDWFKIPVLPCNWVVFACSVRLFCSNAIILVFEPVTLPKDALLRVKILTLITIPTDNICWYRVTGDKPLL